MDRERTVSSLTHLSKEATGADSIYMERPIAMRKEKER
jgi:hypothetical protein